MDKPLIAKMRSFILTHLSITLVPEKGISGFLKTHNFISLTETNCLVSPHDFTGGSSDKVLPVLINLGSAQKSIEAQISSAHLELGINHSLLYLNCLYVTEDEKEFDLSVQEIQNDKSHDGYTWIANNPFANDWTPQRILNQHLLTEGVNDTIKGLQNIISRINRPKFEG